MSGALVNGEARDGIGLADRGLQYGDGVFETIAVAEGRPRHWPRHMARLRAGCERLDLPAPDEQRLRFEAEHLINGQSHCVIKIILTRGNGGTGYQLPAQTRTNRIVRCLPWPDYPAAHARQGVEVNLCQMRLGHNPVLAGIKHLNRLEQVLASREWQQQAVQEGLLLDGAERVIEGSRSNLFLVKDGQISTPDLSQCGVAGVMRSVVLETCTALGLGGEIKAIPLAALNASDELFLCNSLMGLWPVVRVAEQVFPVGPITRRLQKAVPQQPEGEAWLA